ncbi:hypothetical protein MRX96_023029 [Rhipicephalus microplus]
MYVPRPTLEPIVPAATPSASPAWTPPPPVRRHMPHFRNGPTPPPPGGRRTREGMRPPSSQTTETPVGASDSGEFSPDLPAEPDSEIADQLLQKKKKLPPRQASRLNVGGCEHVSPSGERATLSEPRIEYCWPDETPTEQEEEPVAYLRAAEAKPTEPPRAKSSMQDRGRKLGSPRDRGPRRHYSVTAW